MRKFYPFTFDFGVTSLETPVHIQLIRCLTFRQFFSPKIAVAILAVQRYESRGAFNEATRYRLVVHSRTIADLYKPSETEPWLNDTLPPAYS